MRCSAKSLIIGLCLQPICGAQPPTSRTPSSRSSRRGPRCRQGARRDRPSSLRRRSPFCITGPLTALGKQSAARNALRHGLNVPVLADPLLAKEVVELAERVANGSPDPEIRELAVQVAAAQTDIQRVRDARHAVMGALMAEPDKASEKIQKSSRSWLRSTVTRDGPCRGANRPSSLSALNDFCGIRNKLQPEIGSWRNEVSAVGGPASPEPRGHSRFARCGASKTRVNALVARTPE
jgi:hypothetical protein